MELVSDLKRGFFVVSAHNFKVSFQRSKFYLQFMVENERKSTEIYRSHTNENNIIKTYEFQETNEHM